MRQVLVLILLLCVLTTAWSVCICLPPGKAFAAHVSWTCPVCGQTFQFDPRDSAYRDSFAQRHLNAHGYQRPSAPPSYRAPKAPSGPTPEQLERQRQRELKKQRQIEQWQRQKQLQKQRQIRAKNEAYNKGNDYFGRGNWDRAISYYKQALKYDPYDQTIKRRIKQAQAHKVGDKGDKYYNKEDWGNAIKYYKAALRQDPNNATFRRNLQKAEAEAKKGQQKKLAEAKEKQQEKRLREQGTKETLAETSRRLDNLAAELRRPGSSDLWEGAARPGTTAATGQSLDFIDSSVVDLRDAKTLTVYPDVVKGTSTVAMELTAEGWRDTTTPSGSEAKPGGTTAQPGTGPDAGGPSVDSSVVDLRDAKTLVVDPAKVKGDLRDAPADQPAGQGQGSTGQTAQPDTEPSVADELAAAIAHLPEKAQAGVVVGTALISQGKYEEAVKYFEDALEAAPNDEGVRRVLTRAYILRDKALGVPGSPKAEILLDALEVSGARNWDDIRFWQGQLAKEKDPAKVEAIRRNLNESVDRSWEHSIGYLQGQLAQEKDPAKAQVIGEALNEAFNARIQEGEERIRELTGLPFGDEAKGAPGSPKAEGGTPPTAQIGTGPSIVQELDAATAHLPERAKAGVALGTLMISQGKYEEAVRYFEDALKVAPDDQFLQRARDHAYSQRDIARGASAEQPPAADAKGREMIRLEQEVKRLEGLEKQRPMVATREVLREQNRGQQELIREAVKREQDEFDKMNEAWLREQQKLIQEAVERNKKWTKEIMDSIKANRVPSPTHQPKTINNLKSGDILLIAPEKGDPTSNIIAIADQFYTGRVFETGELKSPASHAATFLKEEGGIRYFLDHTPGGSRILVEEEFREIYEHRGMYVARPQAKLDGRKLWEFAMEAAKKTKEGRIPGGTSYGVFGKEDAVCSEEAGLAVIKAAGQRIGYKGEFHRLGPVDITPADFFDKEKIGKYFIVSPMEPLKQEKKPKKPWWRLFE